MVALYDYDPRESSPNVDVEVGPVVEHSGVYSKEKVNFEKCGTWCFKTQPGLFSAPYGTKSFSKLWCFKIVWPTNQTNCADALQIFYLFSLP